MKRKMMIIITAAMMAVSMAACGQSTDHSGNTASTINSSDGSSIADSGYEISPVAILSQQVVAGENHCFLATKDSDGSYVFAYFYEDLDGNVSNAYTVDFETKG